MQIRGLCRTPLCCENSTAESLSYTKLLTCKKFMFEDHSLTSAILWGVPDLRHLAPGTHALRHPALRLRVLRDILIRSCTFPGNALDRPTWFAPAGHFNSSSAYSCDPFWIFVSTSRCRPPVLCQRILWRPLASVISSIWQFHDYFVHFERVSSKNFEKLLSKS